MNGTSRNTILQSAINQAQTMKGMNISSIFAYNYDQKGSCFVVRSFCTDNVCGCDYILIERYDKMIRHIFHCRVSMRVSEKLVSEYRNGFIVENGKLQLGREISFFFLLEDDKLR